MLCFSRGDWNCRGLAQLGGQSLSGINLLEMAEHAAFRLFQFGETQLFYPTTIEENRKNLWTIVSQKINDISERYIDEIIQFFAYCLF